MEEIVYDPDRPKTTDCSVHIVNDMNFATIDAAGTPLEFATWWHSTAKIVIAGMFGGDEARCGAVRAILPVCDMFTSQQAIALRMTTPEMAALHELYAARLIYDEQYIKSMTDGWIRQIDALAQAGHGILCKLQQNERELRNVAERLMKRYAQHGDAARQIVDQKLQVHTLRLRKDASSEVKLARAHALLHNDVQIADTTQIDQRIEAMTKDLKDRIAPEMIQTVRVIYETHKRNIEADAAKRVQVACQANWLVGLRGE